MSDIERELKRLKRGLMTGDERTALPAYKTIYDRGSGALRVVTAELNRFDLTKQLSSDAAKLLAGLVALQRDLDEATSDIFIDSGLEQNCHPIAAAILRSARRMNSRDFRSSKLGSIKILEHASILRGYQATENVQQWISQLPAEDLSGISRIYLVPYDLKSDLLGKYMPVLGVVTIAWTTLLPPCAPFRSLTNRLHRHVLMHEIGHHVHRHWFGQVAKQEAEAEAYSRRAKHTTMPIWLKLTARLFRYPN